MARQHTASLGKRQQTRQQICEAANELFVTVGFSATTMEQIARAAGIQRSTLYTHFTEKEQILAAIGADYVIDVCDIIRQLPGPVPSSADIDTWLERFAAFVSERPGPAELVMAAGHLIDTPQPAIDFGSAMMRAFAEQIDAFEKALKPGEDFRQAWGHATLSELGAALTYRARHGPGRPTDARQAVAAMLLGRFVREEF